MFHGSCADFDIKKKQLNEQLKIFLLTVFIL